MNVVVKCVMITQSTIYVLYLNFSIKTVDTAIITSISISQCDNLMHAVLNQTRSCVVAVLK